MNLVEAPDHAGQAAPPHAPERLRTFLAEGRDAQNDETAQSEMGEEAIFVPLEIDYSESKDSNSTFYRRMLFHPSRRACRLRLHLRRLHSTRPSLLTPTKPPIICMKELWVSLPCGIFFLLKLNRLVGLVIHIKY